MVTSTTTSAIFSVVQNFGLSFKEPICVKNMPAEASCIMLPVTCTQPMLPIIWWQLQYKSNIVGTVAISVKVRAKAIAVEMQIISKVNNVNPLIKYATIVKKAKTMEPMPIRLQILSER